MLHLLHVWHEPEVNALEAGGFPGRCEDLVHVVHGHSEHFAVAGKARVLLLDLNTCECVNHAATGTDAVSDVSDVKDESHAGGTALSVVE